LQRASQHTSQRTSQRVIGRREAAFHPLFSSSVFAPLQPGFT